VSTTNRAYGADGLHAAAARQTQIHERQIRFVQVVQAHRFLARAGLRHHRHLGAGVDDRGDADTHQRMVIDDKNADILGSCHTIVSEA
jgi:hypothetical protein